MAKENATRFIELLPGDPELQGKLKEATAAYTGPKDVKTVFEAVVAPVAAEAGLPFTYEEGIAAAYAGRELSDDELDAVAGGGVYLLFDLAGLDLLALDGVI